MTPFQRLVARLLPRPLAFVLVTATYATMLALTIGYLGYDGGAPIVYLDAGGNR